MQQAAAEAAAQAAQAKAIGEALMIENGTDPPPPPLPSSSSSSASSSCSFSAAGVQAGAEGGLIYEADDDDDDREDRNGGGNQAALVSEEFEATNAKRAVAGQNPLTSEEWAAARAAAKLAKMREWWVKENERRWAVSMVSSATKLAVVCLFNCHFSGAAFGPFNALCLLSSMTWQLLLLATLHTVIVNCWNVFARTKAEPLSFEEWEALEAEKNKEKKRQRARQKNTGSGKRLAAEKAAQQQIKNSPDVTGLELAIVPGQMWAADRTGIPDHLPESVKVKIRNQLVNEVWIA